MFFCREQGKQHRSLRPRAFAFQFGHDVVLTSRGSSELVTRQIVGRCLRYRGGS
jgi:hypothetical protein